MRPLKTKDGALIALNLLFADLAQAGELGLKGYTSESQRLKKLLCRAVETKILLDAWITGMPEFRFLVGDKVMMRKGIKRISKCVIANKIAVYAVYTRGQPSSLSYTGMYVQDCHLEKP